MYSLFLGAGFSKWAVNLPLVNELFDFNIAIFNRTDEKRIEIVKSLKYSWDRLHPNANNEQFVAFALGLTEQQRNSVLWYIGRRLSEPFIWEEFHAQRCRRHVLMIDENRKFGVKGLVQASDFLQGFLGFSIAGIITTNYDLVIEYALGTKLFNYGIPGQVLVGRGHYPVSTWRQPVRLTGKVRLAKVHGSVSWDVSGYYTNGRRSITGNALIVAPTLKEDIPEALEYAWNVAGQILRQSRKLLVFGFAFNEYDQSILDLLQLNGGNIESVLLVDIAPKLKAASQLWPKATITCCAPPTDGNSLIYSWKKSL